MTRVLIFLAHIEFGFVQYSFVAMIIFRLNTACHAFLHDESGATAIEYGVIASALSVAIMGSVGSIGGKLGTAFSQIDANLNIAGGNGPDAPVAMGGQMAAPPPPMFASPAPGGG